jgi:hypothetical protein
MRIDRLVGKGHSAYLSNNGGRQQALLSEYAFSPSRSREKCEIRSQRTTEAPAEKTIILCSPV